MSKSEPAIRVMMMPRDTNAHGTIFGGVILSYIDQAGGVEARKHCHDKFVTVAMDVASRSDPDGLREKITKEVEDKVGATDRLTKLAELLGNGTGNKGPVSRSGGERKSSQPKDEQEAINWHATGKWTNKQMRAWRQAQAVAAR